MSKKRNIGSRLFLVSMILLTLSGLAYATWGRHGIRDLIVLKRHLAHLEARNQQLQEESAQLSVEVELLKNDKRYLEKVARDELGMVKDGELIFIFPSPSD